MSQNSFTCKAQPVLTRLQGVKYLVAVRTELAAELLPILLPNCTEGLRDTDDDVCAAAAEALWPIADTIVTAAPPEVMTHTVHCFCDCDAEWVVFLIFNFVFYSPHYTNFSSLH